MKQKPNKPAPAARVSEVSALPPEVRAGQSIGLLQRLHILTREGKLNQDSRRKLKQVYHLVGFIEKPLQAVLDERLAVGDSAPITLVDHGAGKSYLGFILYDLFFRPQQESLGHAVGEVIGIETRAELVTSSEDLARDLGFAGMRFFNLSVQQALHDDRVPAQVDMVTALHACDTATDDAIAFALAHRARHLALVPCCQAEVAASLRQHKALDLSRTPLAELWRHPLHTREIGSQVTNVLRCLYLEAMGYQVTVTELVGWEHSLKNELIVARYTGQRKRSAAQRLRALLAEFGLQGLEATRYPGLSSPDGPPSSSDRHGLPAPCDPAGE
jgi:Methyltransferase domain